MPRSKNTGNSTTPKPYAGRGTNVSKCGVVSKESASYIEKMVAQETKRKKKKEQKKTEDEIVRRLAKNRLIHKDKVGDVIKKSSKKKKKSRRKARPPPPILIPPRTQTPTLIPRVSPRAPLATTRRRSLKRRRNLPTTNLQRPLRSNHERESKVQKLASGLEEAQKGMIEMATEL